MRRTRSGPSIREFLEYYLLVLLAESRRTKRELIQEISQRSADNRSYRPSGVLQPAARDVDMVLAKLAGGELIRLLRGGQRWRITDEGKAALAEYEGQKEEQTNAKEKAAERLLQCLRTAPGGSYVLDVGTGAGFLAFKLAERGFNVLGIDSARFEYSENSIEEARELAQAQSGNIEFRQVDIRQLAEPDDTFDYVVSSQAMHCMASPTDCLEAVHRLLKPQGEFLCLDFLVGITGFLAHGFHGFLALSREEWVELLLEHGFGNIRMYEVDDYLVVGAEKR